RQEAHRGGALRRPARQALVLEGRLMHRIVRLDVSGDKVRLVALESGFRGFSVLEARSVALPEGATPGERLKAALAQLSRAEDDIFAVALPGTQVASHLVTLPFTDNRRIEQVLPGEVEGAIPFDLEEVVWDHAVLSQANGRTEVLVGVVRKSVLQQALASLAEAGVDPRLVTFAPLARDLKISLRMRGKAGVMSRLLVAGELANLPGAVEKLAADLGIQVEPLALAGEAAQVAQGPGAGYALALGLALRAQQPRGR